MSHDVGIYIHKNLKTNEPLDLEQVWLDIKQSLVEFGAKLLPNEADEKLLDTKKIKWFRTSFIRMFGIASQNSEDYWGCGVYYEGPQSSENPDPIFVPESDDTIQVDEYLKFYMPLNEANLDLIKKLKQAFIENGKYEFSYSFDIGIEPTQLAK